MPLAGSATADKGVSSPTAELCAVVRAAETVRPRRVRLYSDPYARFFLRDWRFRGTHPVPWLFKLVLRMGNARYTGVIAETALRHRHCEAVLRSEIDRGCTQVIVLGAGYDTTALRHDFGADVLVYEVDKPDTQADKLAVLRRNSLRPRTAVDYVSCDFESGDDLAERLLAHGFDPAKRSVVVWMGVTYYLDADAVSGTLDTLSSVLAEGSKVVLDYLDASVVDGTAGRRARRCRDLVASVGEPFTFGTDGADIHDFYTTGDFTVAEHHRIPDLESEYVTARRFWLTVVDFMGVVTLRRS